MLIGYTGELHHETKLDKAALPGHVTHKNLFYAWAYISKGRHIYKQQAVTSL